MLFNVLHKIIYVSKYPQVHSNLLRTSGKCYSTINKNDPSKIATAGTMKNVKENLLKIMGIEKGYQPLGQSRAHLLEYLPTSQNELPPRTMNDSFTSALIPLSTDLELQDRYVSFLGNVRLGRLLEDMDYFAVFVSQAHILNPRQPEGKPSPYAIVTVLVDRIDFTDFVAKPNEDIRLSGHVSWVGKSSIEVVVWLEQKLHGAWRKLTRALFLMAARDPRAERAAFINPLVSTTEEEKLIIQGGESRKENRMIIQSQHVSKVIPNSEEQNIMHKLFLRTIDIHEVSLKKRILPQGCVWMKTCRLSNLVFSHPENRNLHNKLFGGFIMRQALELSWALSYLFSKYRPTLKSISDISFRRPVEVNALLRMHAHIVFTQKQFLQITVYAEVWTAAAGKSVTTNVFHFTYEVPEQVQEVFPHSYQEAMMYIDGRRHFNTVMSPTKLK